MTSSCKQTVFFAWYFEIPKNGKEGRTPNSISMLSTVRWHNNHILILWCFFFCTNSKLKTLSYGTQTKVWSAISFMHHCSFSQQSPADFFSLLFSLSKFPLSFSFLDSSSCSLTASAVLPGFWVEESNMFVNHHIYSANWDIGSSGDVESQLLLQYSG